MSFDIYGQHLRPGYCEVHPDVPEEYPCLYCRIRHAENETKEREYRETCKQQEKEYFEYLSENTCGAGI